MLQLSQPWRHNEHSPSPQHNVPSSTPSFATTGKLLLHISGLQRRSIECRHRCSFVPPAASSSIPDPATARSLALVRLSNLANGTQRSCGLISHHGSSRRYDCTRLIRTPPQPRLVGKDALLDTQTMHRGSSLAAKRKANLDGSQRMRGEVRLSAACGRRAS